jgi:predicted nucleic acid-binding protein
MTTPLPPIVLDSSVAIAFILEEDASRAVRARLRRWVDQGETFVVPSHFWLEVSNVLARVHGLSGKVVLEALYHLDDLGLSTVELDRAQLVLTLARIERHGLTAYDAAYLSVAHSLDATIATLDRRLAEAAGPAFVDPASDTPGRRVRDVSAAYDADGTWADFRGASAYLAKMRGDMRQSAGRPSGD